ncbi:MAG: glycosyltransferase [Nanoarchaeota archaeon]
MRVSIVVPAQNEEKRIPLFLEQYGSYFEQLRLKDALDYEIVVVVNNTQDHTAPVVQRYSRANKRIRLIEFKQGGKGFAVMEGFKDALQRPNDLIGFVDADMATPPVAFAMLIERIGRHQGIIASRWRRDSDVTRQSLLFRFKSFIFNLVVRSLFGFPYRDTQCGAKLFRRESIMYVHDKMQITKWAFDIDLLYKLRKKGFSVVETSTIWESKDDSKIKLIKASLEMFLAVIRLRLAYSPLQFIVRAYDSLPQGLKVHHRIWKQ